MAGIIKKTVYQCSFHIEMASKLVSRLYSIQIGRNQIYTELNASEVLYGFYFSLRRRHGL